MAPRIDHLFIKRTARMVYMGYPNPSPDLSPGERRFIVLLPKGGV
jgi:hypothetical protein